MNPILQDIYKLIDKGNLHEAFTKIAEHYGTIPPYHDLQNEYVAGKDTAMFKDRFKTYVSTLAQTQTPLQQRFTDLQHKFEELNHAHEHAQQDQQILKNAKEKVLKELGEAKQKLIDEQDAHQTTQMEKEHQIKRLQKQLQQTEQNTALQTQIDNLTQQIKQKDQQINTLQTDIQTLKNTLEKQKNALQEGQQAFEKLQARLRAIEPDYQRLKAKEQAEITARETLKRQQPLDFTVGGVSFKMIFVEGGTFQMGSNDYSNEQPIHPVTLTDYYIAETQTTQALYEAVMGNNPAHFKGANLPVEQVSWYDAQAFITKLNEIAKPSVGVWCLPTEAQWEYAARGGKKSGGFRFAGSNDIDKVAWYNGNSETQTHPVAVKWANELGLYDMSGNVWEWCADDYDSEAYQKVKADMLNPICIEGKILEYSAFSSINEKRNNNLKRVLRGGAWRDNGCRASLRVNDTAGNRSNDVGFRLSIMLPL